MDNQEIHFYAKRVLKAMTCFSMGGPSDKTCPIDGLISPTVILTVVLFPAPFGPRYSSISLGLYRISETKTCHEFHEFVACFQDSRFQNRGKGYAIPEFNNEAFPHSAVTGIV